MEDNSSHSYISTARTPDGNTHYYKDAEARDAITDLEDRVDETEEDIESIKEAIKGGTHFIGKCLDTLTDRGTKNPVRVIQDGTEKSVTAVAGDFTVCEKTVSGGTVGLEYLFDGTRWTELGSTGTLKSLAFKDKATASYKPTGTVSKPSASVTPTKQNIDHLTVTVDTTNETLIIGKTTHNVMTGVSVDVSQPTFSGDTKTIEVS